VIADFRIQLGILIDNLSRVYHFGKVPNRTRKSSAGKATKTYKAPKKKAISKRTRSQKHKLIEGVEENQSKSYPFRRRHKSKAKLDHKVHILTEDLRSDTNSILDLLADPFILSPQKKNNNMVVKQSELPEQSTHTDVFEELHYSVCAEEHVEVQQPLLQLYDQPIYPLTAEEPIEVEEVASNDPFTAAPKLDYPLPAGEAKEVDEVASKDPFTAAVELQYPLPAEEANELEEVASNELLSATAELEYPLTAEQKKEVEEAPAELTKEVEEAPAELTKELEEAPAELTKEVEEAPAEQPKEVARPSRAKKI